MVKTLQHGLIAVLGNPSGAPLPGPRVGLQQGTRPIMAALSMVLLSMGLIAGVTSQSHRPHPPSRPGKVTQARPLARVTRTAAEAGESAAPLIDDRSARGALQRYYEAESNNNSNPTVLSALSDLAGFDHPFVVDGLLEVLGQGRISRRPTARRVLSSLSSPASLERIAQKGLGHRDPVVREQVLLALADGRPAGIDWLAAAEQALDDSEPRVRAAAVRAVGLGRLKSSLARLIDLAEDPSQRVRMAIPEALARLAGQRSVPILDALSHDSQWRVRVAVVSALVDIKSSRAVVELIDMLRRESGRVREDILTALSTLTGKNHGLNLKAWERFLDLAPEDFLSRAKADADAQDRSLRSVASYYGLWTLSNRFLFITDLSTSMDHVDRGRYGDTPGLSRLTLTQNELTRLFENLDGEVQFNLATFSEGTKLWRSTMTPASKRNKTAALKQIDHYHTLGGTNIFSSLKAAFDMAEEQLDAPRQDREAPDTVFLLTDGEPSVGELIDTQLLLEYVAERNRVLGLRFQCVALTRQVLARDFLAQLARGSGGQYISPLD